MHVLYWKGVVRGLKMDEDMDRQRWMRAHWLQYVLSQHLHRKPKYFPLSPPGNKDGNAHFVRRWRPQRVVNDGHVTICQVMFRGDPFPQLSQLSIFTRRTRQEEAEPKKSQCPKLRLCSAFALPGAQHRRHRRFLFLFTSAGRVHRCSYQWFLLQSVVILFQRLALSKSSRRG